MEDDDLPDIPAPREEGHRSKTFFWNRGDRFATDAQNYIDSGQDFEALKDHVWTQLWDYDLICNTEAANYNRTSGFPEYLEIEDLDDLIQFLDEREYMWFYNAQSNRPHGRLPGMSTLQSQNAQRRMHLMQARNGWPVQQFLQQREQGQQPRMYQPIDPITNEQHKSERAAALDTKDLVQLFNTNL